MNKLIKKYSIKAESTYYDILNNLYIEYMINHRIFKIKYRKYSFEIYNKIIDIGQIEKKEYFKDILNYNQEIKNIIKLLIKSTKLPYDLIDLIIEYLPKPEKINFYKFEHSYKMLDQLMCNDLEYIYFNFDKYKPHVRNTFKIINKYRKKLDDYFLNL